MNIPASGLQGPTFAANSAPKQNQPVKRMAYVTYIESTPQSRKQQKRMGQLFGLSVTTMLSFVISEELQQGFAKMAPTVAKKVNIPIVLIASSVALLYGALIQALRLSRLNSQRFTLQNPDLKAMKQAGELIELRTNGKVQSMQQGERKGLELQ